MSLDSKPNTPAAPPLPPTDGKYFNYSGDVWTVSPPVAPRSKTIKKHSANLLTMSNFLVNLALALATKPLININPDRRSLSTDP